MRAFITLAALLGLAIATPAMAQTSTGSTGTGSTGGSTNSTNPSATAPAPGAMQADVKKDLEQAGFTDVTVMPSSFLVRAKDKAGRPVMMVINPDSVTEITNVGKPPASK